MAHNYWDDNREDIRQGDQVAEIEINGHRINQRPISATGAGRPVPFRRPFPFPVPRSNVLPK